MAERRGNRIIEGDSLRHSIPDFSGNLIPHLSLNLSLSPFWPFWAVCLSSRISPSKSCDVAAAVFVKSPQRLFQSPYASISLLALAEYAGAILWLSTPIRLRHHPTQRNAATQQQQQQMSTSRGTETVSLYIRGGRHVLDQGSGKMDEPWPQILRTSR